MNTDDNESPQLAGYHKQADTNSTPFIQPEELTPSQLNEIEVLAEILSKKMLGEMLVRLLMYCLPNNNTRLTLTAFAYANGIDLSFIFNTKDNTEKTIGKAIGVTHQTFHAAVMKVVEDFNIEYRNTGKSIQTNEQIKSNNCRKAKT